LDNFEKVEDLERKGRENLKEERENLKEEREKERQGKNF